MEYQEQIEQKEENLLQVSEQKEAKQENLIIEEKKIQQQDTKQENEEKLVKLFMWGSCEVDQYDPGEANCSEGACRSGVLIPLNNLLCQQEQIKSVQCGALHTFLLSNFGRVFSFGCNDDGVLGREGDESTPGLVNLPIRVDLLSTGDSHCICASTHHQKIFHWGVFRSTSGNMTQPQRTATPLQWNSKKHIEQIISGSNHCLIRTTQGKVYVCGDPECQVLGRVPGQRRRFQQALEFEGMNLKGVKQIFTGGNHAFCQIQQKRKGIDKVRVLAWGSNNYGQLGIGEEDKDEQVMVPKDIQFEDPENIVKISGGEHHSIAVTKNGNVWVWGRNDEGELGVEAGEQGEGKSKFIRTPLKLQTIEKYKVEDVISGPTFNFVIANKNSKDQQIFSWGNGDLYILANGKEENEKTPYEVRPAFFKKMILADLSLGAQHGAYLVKSDESIKDIEFDDNQLKIVVEEKVEKQIKTKGKKKNQEQNENKIEEEKMKIEDTKNEGKKIEMEDEEQKIQEKKEKIKKNKEKNIKKENEKEKKKKDKEKKIQKKEKAQTTKKKKEKSQEKKPRAKSTSKVVSKSKSPQPKDQKNPIKKKKLKTGCDPSHTKKKIEQNIKKDLEQSPNKIEIAEANSNKRLHDDAFPQEQEIPNKEIQDSQKRVQE